MRITAKETNKGIVWIRWHGGEICLAPGESITEEAIVVDGEFAGDKVIIEYDT